MVRNRRGALDRRTILGKMVLETVRELETDLGGEGIRAASFDVAAGTASPSVFVSEEKSIYAPVVAAAMGESASESGASG